MLGHPCSAAGNTFVHISWHVRVLTRVSAVGLPGQIASLFVIWTDSATSTQRGCAMFTFPPTVPSVLASLYPHLHWVAARVFVFTSKMELLKPVFWSIAPALLDQNYSS